VYNEGDNWCTGWQFLLLNKCIVAGLGEEVFAVGEEVYAVPFK
jgi:hypothetical protein